MRARILVAAIALVAAIGGGVLYTLNRYSVAPADSALELVPKDAVMYASVFLDPSNDQKRAIRDILEHFPRAETPEEAKDALLDLLRDPLAELGVDYEQDIEPWLGDQAAVFLTFPETGGPDDFDGAALIATEDEDAARALIDRLRDEGEISDDLTQESYNGVEYETGDAGDTAYGFVEGYLVVGTEEGLRAAVDASEGESLGGSEQFSTASQRLTGDRLASFYIDMGAVFQAVERSGGITAEDAKALDAFGFTGEEALAAVVFAEPDALVMEAGGGLPGEGSFASLFDDVDDADLLSDLPADAWIAYGFPNTGELVRGFLEAGADVDRGDVEEATREFEAETGLDLDEDVLSWMEGLAFFFEGTNFQELGFGLVIDSSDPGKSARAIDEASEALERAGVSVRPTDEGDAEGFAVQGPGMPAPVNVLAGDRVVVAYGDKTTSDAVSPEEVLGDDEVFERAQEHLGADYEPLFFLDVASAVELAESMMAGFGGGMDPTYEQDVKPLLDPVSHVVVGISEDGGTLMQKLVIGVG